MTRSTARALGRYDVLVLASLLWFLAKLLRYVFPPLFEALGAEYGVSTASLGWAYTGFMLVYAAMQFPSGALADRIGPVKILTAGALLGALGSFAVALRGSFAVLVAAMLLVGAGTGAHKTVAIGLLSRTYPSRSGRALGVHDTMGTFGGVAAPVVVAVVLGPGTTDWRVLFLVAGGAAVLTGGAFSVRVPRRTPGEFGSRTNPADRPSPKAYVRPFRRPRFAAFVALTLCFGFAYNGVVAFLPLYLARTAGVTAATASLLYALFFVVSLIQLGTGELSDHVGRLPVVVATIGLATLALTALVATWDIGPTVAGVPLAAAAIVAALGIGAHGFRPVRAAHLDRLLPADLAGGGLGVVRTGLMGAGAIAPGLVGVVATETSFRAAFGGLLAVLAMALGIAVALWATE